MPDLGISVGESVATQDLMGGSPPPVPQKVKDRGPAPDAPKDTFLASRLTARLFQSVELFARGPARAFSACLSLPA